jgi:hypothetical protein
MGPQGWKYVNAFSTMTTEELQEANKLWDQAMRLPQSAAAQIGLSFNWAGQMASKGYFEGLDPNCGNEIARSMGQRSFQALCAELGIASPSTKFMQAGRWCDIGLYNGINELQGMPVTAADMVGQLICQAIDSQVNAENGASYGNNMLEGLANALSPDSDWAQKAIKNARETAEKINDAFKDVEAINSPSKVWTGFGDYMMQGLDNGLTENTPTLLGTVSDMGSRLNRAMAGVVMLANDIIETGIDPVITPRLNLSQINGQAGLIDQLFNDRQIRATGMAQPQVAIAGAGGGGMTYNITINSTAMDPKSLAREIEKVIIRR